MTEEQVKTAIQSAIKAVLDEKRPLNFSHVQERSIAHRLALHMEPHFRREWDVDCEYDLNDKMKKTLEGIADCGNRKSDLILPDIIVHHRSGKGRTHNLLVIEIKKDLGQDPCDRRKLELLTYQEGHYQYQLGLYINVDGGNFTCTWYSNGQQLETIDQDD